MSDSSKRRRIRTHYERRVSPDRESFDILDWGSRSDQLRRFQIMIEAVSGDALPGKVLRKSGNGGRFGHVDMNTSTLLDVGCGLADFGEFLDSRAPGCRYVGVDLTPGVIEEAHRRRPDRHLVLADVFEASPFRKQTFDITTCSGVFNLRLGNNDQFVKRAFESLFSIATQCVLANFLHRRARRQYPHCHYYDPDRVCRAVPRTVREIWIFDQYLENDFTVALWR